MAYVQAKNCLFQVDLNGVYVTVACLRSFRFSSVTTEKETTTPIDGKFTDWDYDRLTATADVDGVLVRDPSTNTLFSFADAQINFIELKIRVIFVDDLGLPKVFRGIAIVMDANFDAAAGQMAGGTANLKFKGEYFIEDSLPEYIALRIRLYNNDSAQAFFRFQLIDGNGEAVFQTDTLPEASGGDLANPIDITVPALKGTWYYWFQCSSNIIGNVFSLNAPPTKTTNFNNGLFQESSFASQAYDFTANREVSIAFGVNNPGPGCVAPTIPGSPSLPGGTRYTPWSTSFAIGGTAPFVIANVTKPAWMSITVIDISGTSYVQLSGTPTAIGSESVSFDITNGCGSVSFSDSFIVVANAAAIPVSWDFSELNAGKAYGFRLYVNGILVVTTDVTASGTYNVNPSDSINAQIIGAPFELKHLKVEDSSTTLFEDTGGAPYIQYSWSAMGLETYQITAEGTAI